MSILISARFVILSAVLSSLCLACHNPSEDIVMTADYKSSGRSAHADFHPFKIQDGNGILIDGKIGDTAGVKVSAEKLSDSRLSIEGYTYVWYPDRPEDKFDDCDTDGVCFMKYAWYENFLELTGLAPARFGGNIMEWGKNRFEPRALTVENAGGENWTVSGAIDAPQTDPDRRSIRVALSATAGGQLTGTVEYLEGGVQKQTISAFGEASELYGILDDRVSSSTEHKIGMAAVALVTGSMHLFADGKARSQETPARDFRRALPLRAE